METVILSLILSLLVYDRYEKIRLHFKTKKELEKQEVERLTGELDKRVRERQSSEQRKFLVTETRLIEMSKWIESEKAHRDLSGNDFVAEWISKYAKDVRLAWEHSKCRSCREECRHQLKETCTNYIPEE
jgi:hypothetical protein